MPDSLAENQFGLERFARSAPVKVIAIASGKGGVGKSSSCVNLALALAREGQRVMILDADLGLANVDVLLGLQPTFDLSHVLSGQRTLEEIIVEGPQGIRIVPAASGVREMMNLNGSDHEDLIRGFGALRDEIDVLLVDTAAGIGDSVMFMASACQEVIVVSCNEPAAITDAYALIKLLQRHEGIERFQILSNRIESTQDGLSMFSKLAVASERFLNVQLRYLGGVPEDPLVRRAIEQQRPVLDAYPGSIASRAYQRIAQVVNRWEASATPVGHNPFFRNLLCQEDSGEQDH